MPNESFDERIVARLSACHLSPEQMHGYQIEDVRFMYDNPFSFALMDMGLGKTVTGGTLISQLILDDFGAKILVVGPIAVIAQSWPDEFRAWRHLAPFNVTVLREDDTEPVTKARLARARKMRPEGMSPSTAETQERIKIRHELARSHTSIHFVSFEGIEWLVDFWKRDWPYRTVLVDESSMLKSHNSKRFEALQKVRNTPGLITRLHNFTASFAAEGLLALWAPTYLLDLGERFGKTLSKFTDKFFTQNRYTFKWKLRDGAEGEILAKIADISTVRRRKDYFDVTEPSIIRRNVLLGEHEMSLYKTMEKDSVLALPDAEIEAETAAALCQKLSQMASGVLYETRLNEPEGYDPDIDDEAPDLIPERIVHHIHDRKIEMLREIVAELDGKPLLVAYQHRASLDRLQKAFPKAVKWDKTGKSKAPWNDGKIPMLLMHPKSGGHGQNLQRGGHVVVFFDIPWSREQFTQLIGRLDRQGQKEHVLVFLLTASGTIDETIAQAQQDKGDAEEAALKLLQKLIKRIRAVGVK